MEHAQFVDAIRVESDALAQAARAAGVDATVRSCPEWQVHDLLGHIGRIQQWVTAIVRARPESPTENWRQHEPPSPETAIEWFAEGSTALADALADASPSDAVWTWTPDGNVGFWSRRMAHEVAVHRWDAQTAAGDPQPIDRVLAVDGIQEAFDLAPVRLAANPPRGTGETIHFHCTDGEGEWLLRLTPDGLVVTQEHAKGDVAARGSASDLLLMVWGRLGPDTVDVFGDAALLERFQELNRF
ncbi:MAG: maleylpyruvate isomerase family mycothiol-dependent enzyme [Acidimicrobiia bacterium]